MDDLGENAFGDELQKQQERVDPESAGSFDEAAFCSWYRKYINLDGGFDCDDDEEDEVRDYLRSLPLRVTSLP